MVALREEYHLTLGPGERIQDLIHEGLPCATTSGDVASVV
jgi:hypothetical protein